MMNRREFIVRTTVASTAAAMTSVAASPASGSSARVDCQSHLFCPELLALMEKRTTDPRVFTRDGVRYLQMGDWLRRIPPSFLDVAAKLKAMDANGIGLTALSINDPGPEWFGADRIAVAQMLNDFIAETVRRHPTRFFGLCVLPFPDVAASLVELDRCVRRLGMKGILWYTNMAGRFPDEPEFQPIFSRAVELGIPVLLHPAKPLMIECVKAYEMTSGLGNMFENTIALNRLIMSGVLDEFPTLQLVCPHLGGTLPYIIGRIDHQTQVLKRGPKSLQRAPSEYLRSVWLDVASPLPLAIRFAADFSGPARLLFSSDHPWVEPDVIVASVERTGLPAAEIQRIFAENARQLFRLSPS